MVKFRLLFRIYKVFKKHHEDGGTTNLDKLFGFNNTKGQPPLYKGKIASKRDYKITRDVCGLNLLGYTIDLAANIVEDKIETDPHWNKAINKPKKHTIIGIYKKNKNIFLDDEYFEFDITHNEAKFLKSFPADLITTYQRKKSRK